MQVFINFILKRFSHQIRQFFSIHNTSRNPNRSLPVKIIKCLEICQLPEKFLRQISLIMNDSIMRWCTRSLFWTYTLGRQEKIKCFLRNNLFVNNGSGRTIFIFSVVFCKKFVVYFFINQNKGKLGVIIRMYHLKAFNYFLNFFVENEFRLRFGDPVAIDKNSFREFVIKFKIFGDWVFDG